MQSSTRNRTFSWDRTDSPLVVEDSAPPARETAASPTSLKKPLSRTVRLSAKTTVYVLCAVACCGVVLGGFSVRSMAGPSDPSLSLQPAYGGLYVSPPQSCPSPVAPPFFLTSSLNRCTMPLRSPAPRDDDQPAAAEPATSGTPIAPATALGACATAIVDGAPARTAPYFSSATDGRAHVCAGVKESQSCRGSPFHEMAKRFPLSLLDFWGVSSAKVSRAKDAERAIARLVGASRATQCSSSIEWGTCMCKDSKTGTTIDVDVRCRPTTCEQLCGGIADNVRSTAHAESQARNLTASVLDRLTTLALRHRPVAAKRVKQWRDFSRAPPYLPELAELNAWKPFMASVDAEADTLRGNWCGRGVVIMAGGVGMLPQAIATVHFMREHLKSHVAVEVWGTHTEVAAVAEDEDMMREMAALGIVLRGLPPESGTPRAGGTSEVFALKAAAILTSSFDEVLFLDADAIPIVDPAEFFLMRDGKDSAVFWPDFWMLLKDYKIWDSIGGWPFPETKPIQPSQESGLMVICKSCGGWRPLVLAFFFNFHAAHYYPAMYYGHYGRDQAAVKKRSAFSGHNVPGVGDKDTFQIAWLALKQRYLMQPSAALAGTLQPSTRWYRRSTVCGASFMHRDQANRLVLVHHNSNKWKLEDFVNGGFVAHKNALFMSHYVQFQNEEDAFRTDGYDVCPHPPTHAPTSLSPQHPHRTGIP